MPDHSDFDSRMLAFERAWQQNNRPAIDDFLPVARGDLDAERRRCLLELICIDLEYGWRSSAKQGDALAWRQLQDYCAHFAELGPLDNTPLELIGEEYRARQQWGDRPEHAKFLARFGERRELQLLLAHIDRELRDEPTTLRRRRLRLRTIPRRRQIRGPDSTRARRFRIRIIN